MDSRIAPRTPLDRTFQLFKWNQDFRGEPSTRVSREYAEYLLSCRLATRRSKYQLVLKKPENLKLRDLSCSIKESTILKALSGSEHHRALIESWA